MPAQKVSRSAESDVISTNVSTNPPPSTWPTKKSSRNGAEAAISQPRAKPTKKLMTGLKKDERRRKSEFRQAEKDEKLKKKEVEQKETDDRFTSPELIRSIESSFGKIDFDPCWHRSSAVKPKAYLDVREGHNALRDEWSGDVVFVNPPWSAQDKFVRRAYNQWLAGNVETVVCLVPARTDSIFFHHNLVRNADLYFIEGRPCFFKEDNTSEGTMVATMLVVFGATGLQKRRFAKLVRGAWWPRKPVSGRKREVRASSVEPAKHRGPLYCSVPYARHKWTVICNPPAGPDKSLEPA